MCKVTVFDKFRATFLEFFRESPTQPSAREVFEAAERTKREAEEIRRWKTIIKDLEWTRKQDPNLSPGAIISKLGESWLLTPSDREDLLDYMVMTAPDT